MSILHLAVLAPLVLAVFTPFLWKKVPRVHTGWFVLPIPVILFCYFLSLIPAGPSNGDSILTIPWIPSLGVDFSVRADGLGLLFSLLITGIGMLVVLYSVYYLDKFKEKLGHFYLYLLIFMSAMLGIVLSDNLIVLYTFWELTSFSSFLLIGYWNHRERSRYGAQKSMIITVLGGLAILAGILLLYVMTGTFSIAEIIGMADTIQEHSLFVPALLCFLLGAFTKSAQFPFHIWLPDAMEAPTPVSAYLHSATMVKAGIYLVARMTPVFAESGLWMWLVAGFGMATLLWGSFFAVKQNDLKGILAYSTISQLGLIMSLLGVGAAALNEPYIGESYYVAALTAAVFHLINHATFKGSLFMAAGIIDHETGTRDIRKLGGLINLMPITFTISLVGSFSMAGLPPFNGFLSKEMFFTGMLRAAELSIFSFEKWGILLPVFAWIASVFTFVYSMRLLFKTFTGKLQEEKLPKKPHEAPLGLLLPPVVLASMALILGLFPNILSQTIIAPALHSIMPEASGRGETFAVHISFWHGFKPELFMTIGVAVIGTILVITLRRWENIYSAFGGKLSRLYDSGLAHTESGAHRLTRGYMDRSTRSHLVYIFSFFILILALTFYIKEAWFLDTEFFAPVRLYEVILVVIISLTSLTILFVRSRLTSIILLGTVGYTMALFFVLFRAPDLALTQLVIETVSVSLFLLCFYHLPKIKQTEERMRFRIRKAIISAGVGILVTLMAISAYSYRHFEPISRYYIENTYKKAGGENMVNVILVDFRGFDTLFEICVLGIASLGIFAMIKLRLAKGSEKG
ncbi:Na+/H+ antiporter subunit A [Peribacillus sp. SCS-26]|uniref:Na+/H+ antiporter subunit A n=1 Tax=Paraperibacillus marinus TaxID=3115295 RepID=UPI0039058A34